MMRAYKNKSLSVHLLFLVLLEKGCCAELVNRSGGKSQAQAFYSRIVMLVSHNHIVTHIFFCC